MGNLIRMDLYRMNRAKSFRVCLILSFVTALAATPLEKLLYSLGNLLQAENVGAFPETADLCGMIASPASVITVMLSLLSIVCFFHADMEGGYIKNIAGQMPRKGFTILSRFIASVPHSLGPAPARPRSLPEAGALVHGPLRGAQPLPALGGLL